MGLARHGLPADEVRAFGDACNGLSCLMPIPRFGRTRYLNESNVQTLEPGGSFSMGTFSPLLRQPHQIHLPTGFTNSSLYTGDIDYVDLPVQGSYWILPITSTFTPSFFGIPPSICGLNVERRPDISVNGESVNAPTGEEAYAAIDTGTTLVGGPSSAIAEIFAQIPDSQPGTGDFESYYTYRERFHASASLPVSTLNTLT